LAAVGAGLAAAAIVGAPAAVADDNTIADPARSYDGTVPRPRLVRNAGRSYAGTDPNAGGDPFSGGDPNAGVDLGGSRPGYRWSRHRRAGQHH
jgi:hypothetical protein